MLRRAHIRTLFPGLLLAIIVGGAGFLSEMLEVALLRHVYVDGLVVAILGGTLIRSTFGMHRRFAPGLSAAAKQVLEVAIVLLGGSIGIESLASIGLPLIAATVGIVFVSILGSYGIGRMVGLSDRLATLVACGNSICGNSAIMAAAPVLDAPSEEVAASIAFTAVLGIGVVLLLPLSFSMLGLSPWRYGVVAGLSVYAVPQVLAATLPVGPLSAQIGTVVKLVRVLMLGPVVLLLGLRHGRMGDTRLPVATLVPWFVVGFGLLMILQSLGAIPEPATQLFRSASSLLTLVAMAGLGLSVNLRSVVHSGGRVLAAGIASIALLLALAVGTAVLLP